MTRVTHDDLREGLLLQNGRDLYQVSTVNEHGFTAQALLRWNHQAHDWKAPPRTSVVGFSDYQLAVMSADISPRLEAKLREVYSP